MTEGREQAERIVGLRGLDVNAAVISRERQRDYIGDVVSSIET